MVRKSRQSPTAMDLWKCCAVIALLLPVAAGCYPEFTSTLSDEKTSKVDKRLLGKWYLADDKLTVPHGSKRISLMILQEKGTNAMTAVAKGGVDERQRIYTFEAEGQWFMSVPLESKSEDGKTFIDIMIFAYRVDKDAVRAFWLREDHFFHAVKEGKLKGRLKRTKPIPARQLGPHGTKSVLVTDTPADLRKFISADVKSCIDSHIAFTLTRKPPKKHPPETPRPGFWWFNLPRIVR